MGLRGERADHEPSRDLGVARALGHEAEDLAFAVGHRRATTQRHVSIELLCPVVDLCQVESRARSDADLMRPVLFELGGLEVRSYGMFVAVAFFGAFVMLRHELGRRLGRADAAAPIVLAAVVGGLIGARVYWMLEQGATAASADLFSSAGFTWYGGVVGGTAAVLLVARWQHIGLSDLLGTAAPALALGYALGRIACQFAGDGTYGVASDLPWAMAYPDGEIPTTQRVHPTPVYETLSGLLIVIALWRLRDCVSGPRLFGVYLVAAGMERFLVEFIRRNDELIVGLTQPQLWSLAMILGGLALLTATRRKPAPRRRQRALPA